jgi:hypothetical protein
MEARVNLVLMRKIYARKSLLTFKALGNISLHKIFPDIWTVQRLKKIWQEKRDYQADCSELAEPDGISLDTGAKWAVRRWA